ncbi:MAG: DUF4234 domain-containing protein [Candidatus Dormibacteraeota bacterium]|uniref:DUF4234 domain-containing protein n=1 Tax=Candidatus Amunia macphersoniae TaxID=3127014 RepID=A0A934KHS8_9BACT|nr:DUF4234 domain-containing protein [Candidatus Dormibacteraeota bacterium]
MADDAAHVPGGPAPDITRADIAARPRGTGPVKRDSPEVVPTFAQFAGKFGSDVELVGRTPGDASAAADRELVATGAAASATADPLGSRPAPAQPSPWHTSETIAADDGPKWTFGGAAATREVVAPGAEDVGQAELPFAATAAAPLASRPLPLFGPVGRARAALVVPLLSVVTLGVYALVWHHRINRELEEFDPKLHARPRRSMVALLVPWLIGLAVSLAGATMIISSRVGVQLPIDLHVTTLQAACLLGGLAVVPYLTMLLPFSIVAVVMTLERLRCVEEHIGATTDRQVRPVGTSLLLAVPLVGGLVLIGLEQRRLNAVWQAVAPAGHLYS